MPAVQWLWSPEPSTPRSWTGLRGKPPGISPRTAPPATTTAYPRHPATVRSDAYRSRIRCRDCRRTNAGPSRRARAAPPSARPPSRQMAGKRGARALRLLCRARQQQGARQHAHHHRHLRPRPTRMQRCRHTESADMRSKANRALDTARRTNSAIWNLRDRRDAQRRYQPVSPRRDPARSAPQRAGPARPAHGRARRAGRSPGDGRRAAGERGDRLPGRREPLSAITAGRVSFVAMLILGPVIAPG
jgi:hypothetical protein